MHFYSFTPKCMKPKTMVLKRVKGGFEENNIIEEINRYDLPNVKLFKVAKMIFNKQIPENYHFIIQITQESIISELKSIKIIAHQKVRWEFIKKKKIYQCKNCQRLGHASASCNLPYRCVKCAETHPKGECKISTQDQKTNLRCANCGGQGHPANYKGCPFYKYANNILIQGRKEESKKIQQVIRKAITINKFIEPGVSFADKTKNVKVANTNHLTIKQLSDSTESKTHTTNTTNNSTSGLKEFENEIISMMKAFQNANNLLNKKLDNNYKQLQDMINKNMENINTKQETITANLNEKINSNANNIEKMLNSFMEVNCE